LNVYNSYLWNTTSSTSSITVTQPGIYWLQVTNNDHCTGRDSILVNPKDCMKGFYIPTAFTPNNDGNNDIFMPLLFGNVKQYRFTIYNRWGEKVFETRQPAKGWDGMTGGTKQDTHVFVWSCTYQFEGEEVKEEKGTVVLIR
jgi:gliding motility-associated-like protein